MIMHGLQEALQLVRVLLVAHMTFTVHNGQAAERHVRPVSRLGLHSRFDLAPKRLRSRLSYHLMTRPDLKFL